MLLNVANVSKSYARQPNGGVGARSDQDLVLNAVNISMDRRQTVALTGESGSGKSTLLHLIAGLDVPDQGTIMLNGVRINAASDAARAAIRQRGIGIVFQQFNLVPSLTVLANIRLQARLAGREDKAQIDAIVEALSLQSQLSKYPEALSGGQQQRVAIARALAVRPKLLLADEPTGNLDETTSDAVLEQLLALVDATDCALLMVTHSNHLASRLQRHLRLSQGQLQDMQLGTCA
ncbi:MAG: ABC transporter ATP-binding protein [Sphingomonadales bacterium]